MGLIDIFKNKKLFIDTAPMIYYIKGHSKYQKALDQLFRFNVKGQIEFITSTLTLLELLVQLILLNRLDLVENSSDAERVMKVLPKRFEKYTLELHPDKIKIVNLRSKRGEGNRSFDFLGFTHYLGKSRKGKAILKRKTQRFITVI